MDPSLENLLQEGVKRISWSGPPLTGGASRAEGIGPFSPSPSPAEECIPPMFTHCSSESNAAGPSCAAKKKKATAKTNRTTWTAEEDSLLVSAWLNVSQDLIVSSNQSSETYWGRIVDYFKRHKNLTWPKRSMKGMINHWQTISADTSKFVGHMNEVDALNSRGTNHRLGMAAKMFKEVEGKSFRFLHCWAMLREHPKWVAHLVNKWQKTNDFVSPGSSLACSGSNDGPVEIHSLGLMDLPRPIGRDSAKKSRARGASSNSSHGSIIGSMYSDHFAEMNQHKTAFIELRRKEVTIMEEEHLDKIMAIDLDKLDGVSREYFRKRKEEIVMKRYGPQ